MHGHILQIDTVLVTPTNSLCIALHSTVQFSFLVTV